MVIACMACKNKYNKNNPEICIHRFPGKGNQNTRIKWVAALEGLNLKPDVYNTGRPALCSAHFKPEDYEVQLGPRRHLKRDAVPSIFGNSDDVLLLPKVKKVLSIQEQPSIVPQVKKININFPIPTLNGCFSSIGDSPLHCSESSLVSQSSISSSSNSGTSQSNTNELSPRQNDLNRRLHLSSPGSSLPSLSSPAPIPHPGTSNTHINDVFLQEKSTIYSSGCSLSSDDSLCSESLLPSSCLSVVYDSAPEDSETSKSSTNKDSRRTKELTKRIKTLQQKVRRRDKQIYRLKVLLKRERRKNGSTRYRATDVPKNRSNGISLQPLKQCIYVENVSV